MEGEPQAKTARGDISTKYAQKSDAFWAKKNPEAIKKRDKDEDFEIKDLKRKVYTASSYKLPAPKPYIEQPTITLRSLMPGDSKDADPEDRRLDMSFKAEKVEFLLVARPITDREVKEGCILESVNESAWDIPEAEDFEDAMGKATNMLCTGNKHLIHQVLVIHDEQCTKLKTYTKCDTLIPKVSWSSVASQTGIGAFSMRTDNMEAMETLRAAIRSLVFGSSCFESFPKDALVQKFGLSIFFPRACAHVDEDLLIEWLRSCNPGLKGAIETIECREYKKTHPVVRRRGAKIITFTGDEEFLDSLHSFPSNFPFSIKIANAYIRGGDRVKERYAGGKSQRPRISQGALRDLLKRNSNMMADAAAEAEDRLAEDLRRTDLQGNFKRSTPPATNPYISFQDLQYHLPFAHKLTYLPSLKSQAVTTRTTRSTPSRCVVDSFPQRVALLYPQQNRHDLLIGTQIARIPYTPGIPASDRTAAPRVITFCFLIKFLSILFAHICVLFPMILINYNDKFQQILTKIVSHITTKLKLYSAKMLTGHGFYPIGDSHEQRRHSWFSKSRVAPTAPEIRLGLGLGSTCCRGYSGTTFNIGPDSACLIVIITYIIGKRYLIAPRKEENTMAAEASTRNATSITFSHTRSTNKLVLTYTSMLVNLFISRTDAWRSKRGRSQPCGILTLYHSNDTNLASTNTRTAKPEDHRTEKRRNHSLTHNAAFFNYSLCSNIASNKFIFNISRQLRYYSQITSCRYIRMPLTQGDKDQLPQIYNQLIILFRQIKFPAACSSPADNQLSGPLEGPINCLDKFSHKVFSTHRQKIKAFNRPFFFLQGHILNARDDSIILALNRGLITRGNPLCLAPKFTINSGNPSRYVSRPLSINTLILTQTPQQATPHSKMEGALLNTRMAVRHPAITTRQLLPRDSALIHPEIKELDTPHRPTHATFLILSREITHSEMEAGELGLPICRATWDFPDPDDFYKVLEQVVDLLEPAHRRPGALITAASASEALGICIIQIKNEFGHSMDFIRRAFRGAHLPGTRLESFPLDAFLPPTSIHLNKPWTMGMKRYTDQTLSKLSINYLLLPHTQAPIYGKCQRCPPQPAGHATNDWPEPMPSEHGRLGARRNGVRRDFLYRSHFKSLVVKNFIKIRLPLINLFIPCTTPNSLIPPASTHMSLSSKHYLHIVTGTKLYPGERNQRCSTSDNNISSKEEGTPTPPRVESLASTASSHPRVKPSITQMLCTVGTKAAITVTGLNPLARMHRTPKAKTAPGPPAPSTRMTSLPLGKPEARHLPVRSTQTSPTPGLHQSGKHHLFHSHY